MLWWVALLVAGAIALGILGFVVIAGLLALILKILFFLFLVLLAVALILYLRHRLARD